MLFEKCGFEGKRAELCHDSANLAKEKMEMVSSIKVAPGTLGLLYANDDFKGVSHKFKEDESCFDNQRLKDFNNKASSFEIFLKKDKNFIATK